MLSSLNIDTGGAISLMIGIAIVAFIAWLIVTYIPMKEIAQRVIYGIAIVAIAVLVFRFFGIHIS